ncbi:MAG: ATP-dependent Clp protease ATP-binding subunit, partial [Clostridia bacterium]|nr:ATP-dependent Clp protease ATP-binding subunit [Clostridia bacterium]
KNTVVIMTSNVGAAGIVASKPLGFSAEGGESDAEKKAEAAALEALKATFRPEFLNRLDEIIVFRKLTDENIRRIAGLMLDEVAKRVADVGISLSFDESVAREVAREGYDPVYGARPLRRAVTHAVEDALSGEMLEGRVKAGDSVLAVWRDGAVRFDRVTEKAP